MFSHVCRDLLASGIQYTCMYSCICMYLCICMYSYICMLASGIQYICLYSCIFIYILKHEHMSVAYSREFKPPLCGTLTTDRCQPHIWDAAHSECKMLSKIWKHIVDTLCRLCVCRYSVFRCLLQAVFSMAAAMQSHDLSIQEVLAERANTSTLWCDRFENTT